MPTTFNKIHRLKNLWTWETFIEQYGVGPDIKTLKTAYRYPHHKPSRHTVALVDKLHDREFPGPFPAEVDGLMDIYESFIRSDKKKDYGSEIQKLESYISFEIERGRSQLPLRDARFYWLLGDICFDRIPAYRNVDELDRLKARAIAHYQQALAIIECETELSELVKYKARQNILACHLNAAKRKGSWVEDKETLDYFEQSDFLGKTKEVLSLEPFNWNIARNGLRFASMLHDQLNVRYFYNQLINVSKLFQNLDYEPYETPALSRSSDFQWAIENVLMPSTPGN
ncbi:hypothetical protein BTA51_19055 [Hahella sp. CCB-MM4]|uniref:hypothetical protein n=1 Tax=Hahella sp. (strain CCB-MM4) TaxID=1926491 RepID=UPI000B9AA9E4|nr:hypothetical protein [Hahella sp. CCB-MM4]OZG71741.1 hypothetical protein BTA51_19055 [Hahella sp. CCB-MM4]